MCGGLSNSETTWSAVSGVGRQGFAGDILWQECRRTSLQGVKGIPGEDKWKLRGQDPVWGLWVLCWGFSDHAPAQWAPLG